MADGSETFFRKHWEGYKKFWGERFSILENYSRFIKRDKPLPSWSASDVEEFIASDPVNGPLGSKTQGGYSALKSTGSEILAKNYMKSFSGRMPIVGHIYKDSDKDQISLLT
ncbi:hypothetical protein GH714_003948 [Hevea brasiliensis]|uniref:Uncharacterized protein n=1 Tax=Hevea brasiliensis TaxID=3981 RepID=A0A6A6LEF4_HEVBR|nr:hypothetical protein GH714_003948 [Hevea brasiliensis]